jgi:hypothetical protein
MKRNLKRKHLSHERTKGSVDHGKGAAKFDGFVTHPARQYLWPLSPLGHLARQNDSPQVSGSYSAGQITALFTMRGNPTFPILFKTLPK